MDTRSILPEVFTNIILEGVDIILTIPTMMAQHLPRSHKGNTLPGRCVEAIHIVLRKSFSTSMMQNLEG